MKEAAIFDTEITIASQYMEVLTAAEIALVQSFHSVLSVGKGRTTSL